MKLELLQILKPGLFTTIQDYGRYGYQQYGVAVSGAMDIYSMQIANILVGNRRHDAVIEITELGPSIQILDDITISICGANLSPVLDGKPVRLWSSFKANRGQILHFGEPLSGRFCYIAISGGMEVPSILGSKSTYYKAAIGGLNGRPLKKGDIISGTKSKQQVKKKMLPSVYIPNYRETKEIRVLLGPDQHYFTDEGISTFFESTYILTSDSDRMGYRYMGPTLTHQNGADIISSAILPGTIQVPANGQPIILMADRPTTGGYARIATVISADLPFVAQMKPGDKIWFKEVSLQEAQNLYKKTEAFLRIISSSNFL